MTSERHRFSKRVRWTFAALLSITVIGGIVLPSFITRMGANPRKGPVPLRHAFNTIGDDLGSWSRAVGRDGKPMPDSVFGMETIEALGTDLYLDRLLSDGDRQINVSVVYKTGMIDHVYMVPERCWDANVMRKSIGPKVVDLDLDFDGVTTTGSPVNPATGDPYPVVEVLELGRPVPVHLPVGTPEMTITQFDTDRRNPQKKQLAGYFFIVDGRLTSDVRDAAWNYPGYSCKVQLSYLGTRQDGEGSDAVFAEFVEVVEDLLPSLLPEIMHCLPDSPGIEGSAGLVKPVGAPPVEATRSQKTNRASLLGPDKRKHILMKW